MSMKETKDGTTITIFVKPNSRRFAVEREGDEIVVYSTEEPVKGKVNKEILKEISKLLDLKVEIVSGATSRQKVLLVRGVSKSRVEAALNSRIKSNGIQGQN